MANEEDEEAAAVASFDESNDEDRDEFSDEDETILVGKVPVAETPFELRCTSSVSSRCSLLVMTSALFFAVETSLSLELAWRFLFATAGDLFASRLIN